MTSRVRNDNREWNNVELMLQKYAEENDKTIVIRNTHQDTVQTVNKDPKELHIFNWALPEALRENFSREDSRNHFELDNSRIIELMGSESDCYTEKSRFSAREDLYNYIRSKDNKLLAINDFDNNNLFILYDICHYSFNESPAREFLSYILQNIKNNKTILTVEEANRTNPEEITATFIQVYRHKIAMKNDEEIIKDLDRRVEEKYTAYLKEIKTVANEYRMIKANKIGDIHAIAKKGTAVAKSLSSNPFIKAVAITNQHIRVTTKGMLSKYYEGEKSLLISIPIFLNDDHDVTVRVYEVDGTKILRLPWYDDHIYPESNICLGTLNRTISMNILGGDWDLAVMSIIRGMIGSENTDAFSEMLRYYASEPTVTTLSRAVMAAYGSYMHFHEGNLHNQGGREVEDLTASEDGHNNDCDDDDNQECPGDCRNCDREDCDDREYDPSEDCDRDCRSCREDCDNREEERCTHDCENCGNDCDDRPVEESEEEGEKTK
jgi:hypothetical protein